MTLITATTGTSPGAYCSRPEQVALCIEAPALNRFINDKATWTLPATAIPARSDIDMSQRLIAEEPMYMVLNLGISPGFQQQDYEHMEVRRSLLLILRKCLPFVQFPAYMHVDYVRVYQRDDAPDEYIGCSPPRHPTKDYIAE